jgi:hypothetical protein
MRNINIGDEVAIIEVWNDPATGLLAPEQSTAECRFYGFCKEITPDGILAVPELDEDAGIVFPSLIIAGMKQGDSIVMHVDDAKELFPVISTDRLPPATAEGEKLLSQLFDPTKQ